LLKLGQTGTELLASQRAHASAMLELFEKAEPESWTDRESAWLAAYGVELDNIRAALDWSAQHDPRIAIALLGAGRFLFAMRGLDYELRLRCESLEPHEGMDIAPAVAARYWLARSECTQYVQFDRTRVFALKAAALYRELGDDRGLFLALCSAAICPPMEEGRRTLDQMSALERPDWPARVRFHGRRSAAFVAIYEGRVREVGAILEQALELARACDSQSMADRTLHNLADQALAAGDLRKAVDLGRQLLLRATERRTYLLLVVLGNLANALLQSGEVAEARDVIARFNESSRAAQWDTFGIYAAVFALLAACEGRVESAARLVGYGDRCYAAMGAEPEPNEVRARELALARVAAELDAAELQRLMAEGERLDEEAVCALTLEPVALTCS
jgi:tetratricopeptide (TPR) repeat protein